MRTSDGSPPEVSLLDSIERLKAAITQLALANQVARDALRDVRLASEAPAPVKQKPQLSLVPRGES